MNNIGKWMFNINESEIWIGEEYNTKKEAIEEGIKEVLEENKSRSAYGDTYNYFHVGQIEKVVPCGVDVDWILENVAENTIDGMEVGEDYLNDVEKNHLDELEEKLNEVLFDWMDKYGYKPTFFKIENEEKIFV